MRVVSLVFLLWLVSGCDVGERDDESRLSPASGRFTGFPWVTEVTRNKFHIIGLSLDPYSRGIMAIPQTATPTPVPGVEPEFYIQAPTWKEYTSNGQVVHLDDSVEVRVWSTAYFQVASRIVVQKGLLPDNFYFIAFTNIEPLESGPLDIWIEYR